MRYSEYCPAEPTPLEQVEALYQDLIAHYGEGREPELRAAAKLLLVALAKFREHGGADWATLLDEYVRVLKTDPVAFQRMLDSNRGTPHDGLVA